MVFINEANESSCGNFCFPNVTQAIEREYKAYQNTISEPDLMFVLTYLQDKLDQLTLDRSHLEDMFCDDLVSKTEELHQYKGGVILHKNEGHTIEDVKYDILKNLIDVVCTKVTVKIDIQSDKIMIDDKPYEESESLLVCKFDIGALWQKFERYLSNKQPGSAEETEDTIKDVHFSQNDCRHEVVQVLKLASQAQNISCNIFSFFPPTQWIEQLIVYTVQSYYSHEHPDFVLDVKKQVKNLSPCCDKSLYFIFYSKFLQTAMPMTDSTQTSILKVLKSMKHIFISGALCTLVNLQTASQAKIDDASFIVDELIDHNIINSVGLFQPSTTLENIRMFCLAYGIDETFLKKTFRMQTCINQVTDKEMPYWNHKLKEIQLRILFEDLIDDDRIYNQILMYIYQMQRLYGELEVITFVEMVCRHSLGSVLKKDQLLQLFSKCSSREWIYSKVESQIKTYVEDGNTVSDLPPICQAFKNLQSLDWESQRNHERTATEIVESIKVQLPQTKEDLKSELDKITKLVENIKCYENFPSQMVMKEDNVAQQNDFDSVPIIKFSKLVLTSCELW